MSINIADNMGYNGKKPLDNRTSYTTLALMKAVTDANINEGCLAYCAETDKYYKFLSTNSVDADTGKWREFSSGGGGGTSDYPDLTNKPSIEGVTLSGNKTAADLGLAKSSQIPSTSDCYKTGDTAFTAIADGDYVPMYDTSDTAKKKSTWSNIKSVLKTYFDTLYNKVTNGTGLNLSNGTMSIKQFGSGDMDEVISELPQGNTLVSIANAFNKGDIYSTSEKMIGQWTDGKPLYQKTINFGSLPNATAKSVATGISNISQVVDIKGFYYSSAGNVWSINDVTFTVASASVVDTSVRVQYDKSTNTIKITTNIDRSTLSAYVTIRYTKSTDSSVSIGEETEYSTSEKIVGSWIDGKPIYQKSFSTTTPTCSTDGTDASTFISVGASISTVIDIKAIIVTGAGMARSLSFIGGTVNTTSGNIPMVRIGVNNNSATSNANKIQLTSNRVSYSELTCYVTVQYTKV